MNAVIYFKPIESVDFKSVGIENLNKILYSSSTDSTGYSPEEFNKFFFTSDETYSFQGETTVVVNGAQIQRIEFYN